MPEAKITFLDSRFYEIVARDELDILYILSALKNHFDNLVFTGKPIEILFNQAIDKQSELLKVAKIFPNRMQPEDVQLLSVLTSLIESAVAQEQRSRDSEQEEREIKSGVRLFAELEVRLEIFRDIYIFPENSPVKGAYQLSNRTFNALAKKLRHATGYFSEGRLVAEKLATESDISLLSIWNFGEGSLQEVRDLLAKIVADKQAEQQPRAESTPDML